MESNETKPNAREPSRWEWRWAVLVSAICLCVYTLFWSGHQYSIDGMVMFQYAKALTFQHSLVMDPPVRWGGDIQVSRWAIGLSLAYVPVLLILSRTVFAGDISFTQIPYDPNSAYSSQLLANKSYLYCSFVNPVVTAATVALLYLLSLQLGLSRRGSVAVALVYGLASPAAVYAKYDYAQPLASLTLLLSFLLVCTAFRLEKRALVLLSGIAMAMAVTARTEMLLVQAPILALCVYCLYARRRNSQTSARSPWSMVGLFSLPVVLAALANQCFNYLRLGRWTSVGYRPLDEFTLDPVWTPLALLGHLISPGRGIIVFFPFAILAMYGLICMRRNPVILTMGLSIFGSLLLYSVWKDWHAGMSWGPRFLVPYFPYLTLLAFLGLDSLHRLGQRLKQCLMVTLVAIGGVFTLQGLLFNFLPYYIEMRVPEQLRDHDAFHFFVDYSPIFADWTKVSQLAGYDMFWTRALAAGDPKGIVGILLIVVTLIGLCIVLWKGLAHQVDPNASDSAVAC